MQSNILSDTDLHNITPTYFRIEVKDDPDDLNYIKTETITLDDNISQYVIRRSSPNSLNNDQYIIPSTSNEFSMMIEEVKHEPEEILHDLILPEVEEIEEISELQQLDENEGFEIIEERTIAYEVKRNAQGELECPICLAIFKIGANLERHIQIHDKKYVFNLTKSNETTNQNDQNQATAQQMPMTTKAVTYACEYCNQTFEYKKLLRKHLTTQHKNRKRDIKCQLCVYCTDNKHHFREHLLRHQKYDQRLSTNPDLVKCIKCTALLKNDRSLKIHEKHVHSSTKYQCHVCEKLFKTKQILKNHLKVVHSIDA
ncbi:hypothetical protein PVAND_014892 [Polypedilum vanderplanki]|uniref:C2H2-type domain-containing protein n=1 Tax=Polypedilum vanderplanki TaxID=319348 RepID=A0A9J6BB14_POLVA|nr:hypothetical protein PVAND_014892 [Polypedilum vanderplanki]